MTDDMLESEQRWRLILDNLPRKVSARDRDLAYVVCNKR